jgi:hypothetical protein
VRDNTLFYDSVMRLIATSLVILTTLSAISCGTTSGCGLALVQQIFFPLPDEDTREQGDAVVACCGGTAFQDVDLMSAGTVEVDLSNPSPAGSNVDGFVTSAGCAKLFNGPYVGTVTAPLCTIYVGPVAARAVSGRKTLEPRKYSLVLQAYTTNTSPIGASLELGLWSTKCRWNPIGP